MASRGAWDTSWPARHIVGDTLTRPRPSELAQRLAETGL